MYLGTGKKPDSNWFQPLSSSANPEMVQMPEIQTESVNINLPADQLEIMNVVENEISEEVKDAKVQQLRLKLKQALAKLEEKVDRRLGEDIEGYEKALNNFEKHIDRLPVGVDSSLQSSLCKFGTENTPALSVMKQKKGQYINVQATSRSRRAIPLRGSRSAFFGAPRKGQQLRSQLNLSGEDQDIYGHKLPEKSRKKKKKHPHNLIRSVLEGRAAEKKH